ncbi:MAG: hypothetical protein WCT32_03550 [Patescibacteria group bacterium]|jgi:hypothetical protein
MTLGGDIQIHDEVRQIEDEPGAAGLFVEKFMEQSPYKDLVIEDSNKIEIDNLPAWVLGDAANAKKLPAWFAKEFGGDSNLALPVQAMVRVKPDGKLGIGLVIAGTISEGGNRSYDKITDAVDDATKLLELFCDKAESREEWEVGRHDKTDDEKQPMVVGEQSVSSRPSIDDMVSELVEAAIIEIESRWAGMRHAK